LRAGDALLVTFFDPELELEWLGGSGKHIKEGNYCLKRTGLKIERKRDQRRRMEGFEFN